MADNSIDLVVSKVAFEQLDRLLNEIKLADAAITALNVNAGKAQATPSGAEGNAAANAALVAQMKALTIEIDKQAAQIQKLSEAKKTYNREVTQDSVNQTIKNQKLREEFKATSDQIDNYQKLDAAYKKATKSAQDLGAQHGENSKQFLSAANNAKELGLKLQNIDAAVGKYGRNVGNYASGWNGLANSVNQLTREAPAFANSLNTGFMALSNNIPILADEIVQLTEKNKKLADSGKPTESIFKTLIGATFSWQTLLSVGVTLLTIYGGKLFDMARGLGDVEAAQKSIKKSQKESDNAIVDTTRNILHQGEIRKNVAREQGATERKLFEMGKEDQIEILRNLEAQRDKAYETFNNIVDYRNKNYQDVKTKVSAELELEGKKNKSSDKYAALNAQRAKELRQMAAMATDENALLLRNDAIAKESAVRLQAQKISEMAFFEKKTSRQRRERMLLDFSEEKSLAVLRVAQYEKEKQLIVDKLNAFRISSAERLDLEMELQAKTYDVLVKEFDKEKVIAQERGDKDKERNDLQLKNSQKTEKDYALHKSNIAAIDNRVNNEIATSKVEFDKKTESLDAEALKRNLAHKAKMKEQSYKLRIAELDEAITINKLIADDNVKGEHQTFDAKQKAFEAYIKLAKERIKVEEKIALASAVDPTEIETIQEHYKAVAKALDNIKSPADNAKEAMRDMAKSFTDSFVSSSGFAGLYKIFDGDNSLFKRITDGSAFTRDSWKADTIQMMEAAQEMYNYISSASQANFEAEYSRLEKQKAVALTFAGESDSAKKKIEEDAEKRKKEIATREFKAKQQQALFNIAIDTAQAILGIWAHGVDPTGISQGVQTAIVAALGIAQAGVVMAQKIPQYFEGTDNHPGGLALINDGKGANFKETVVTPDGKVRQYSGRDVVIDAPAGTQVFTHDQWNNELNTMMREKGISMSNSFTSKSGLTYQEMDSIIAKHFSKITTQSTTIDKNGFNTFVSNGNSKTIRNQSRYSGTGFSV
jgi:hypothetical protein